MTGGFLNRWSRRKAEVKTESQPSSTELAKESPLDVPLAPNQDAQEQATPPPVTLEDVEKIDRLAPDFSAFMRPGVDPAVQQAAMKKMFSDPHFNIMDGLDIYIDDYSKPDPIPLEMLKRMVQTDTLNIFRKDPEVLEGSLVKEVPQIAAKENSGQALAASTSADAQAEDPESQTAAQPSAENSANKKTS